MNWFLLQDHLRMSLCLSRLRAFLASSERRKCAFSRSAFMPQAKPPSSTNSRWATCWAKSSPPSPQLVSMSRPLLHHLGCSRWAGQDPPSLRLWRHYFQNTQGIIFVVGSNDRELVSKVREDFQRCSTRISSVMRFSLSPCAIRVLTGPPFGIITVPLLP